VISSVFRRPDDSLNCLLYVMILKAVHPTAYVRYYASDLIGQCYGKIATNEFKCAWHANVKRKTYRDRKPVKYFEYTFVPLIQSFLWKLWDL
jgi:hypothetical protein